MRGVVLLLGLTLSCSSGTSGAGEEAGTCPDDLPKSCPSPVPSYSKDIVPIMRESCANPGCHSSTGVAGYPETTYAEVFAQRSPILDQLNDCLMPPNTYPLTAQQREALLAWLVCGAPDN